MRALVVSDIHGNIDALAALDAHLGAQGWRPDHIVVLGDLVDYGPEPEAVVRWTQDRANAVVCGNHDFAMATGEDCRSSPAFHPFAVATRDWFRPRLDARVLTWLDSLPHKRYVSVPEEWLLVHATPRAPLFEYLPASRSDAECRSALGTLPPTTRAVLVGHSHEPFVRRLDERWVVNPGSLGLPKDGDPRASYATWEDGRFSLHRVAYDVDRAVARLRALPLPSEITGPLGEVLRSGSADALRIRREDTGPTA